MTAPGMGPLEVVAAAVTALGDATAAELVAVVRPPGSMTVARVEDALGTLLALGVVRPTVHGWAPGPVALADLPVPVSELERGFARGVSSRARGRAASRARGL